MIYVYKFKAMSTLCEVSISLESKIEADKIAQEILKESKRLEKKYNYYDKNSLLDAINRRAENILDNESKSLIQRAVIYYNKTNKIFDITVATIKDIYQNSTTLTKLSKEKNFLSQFVGCEHLSIKRDKIYFDNPYTKIDLGGFVKEYAVDQAVKILKKRKIKSALINFGGDVYALGKKSNDQKFKIAIKDPSYKDKIGAIIEIEDEALTTSASYERNFMIEDQIFSHIISTSKSNNSPASVSVISKNCVESGVYSTALMIDSNLNCSHKVIVI